MSIRYSLPSLRTLVSSAVSCLLEMTVPTNLTLLRLLMTSVKTVSEMVEMLTLLSTSKHFNWDSLFR